MATLLNRPQASWRSPEDVVENNDGAAFFGNRFCSPSFAPRVNLVVDHDKHDTVLASNLDAGLDRLNKLIVFRGLVDYTTKYRWYAISPFSTEGQHKTTLVEHISEIEMPFSGTCIALDSVIYCLGGESISSDGHGVQVTELPDVSILDTRNPEEGWKKGPPMLCPRSCPQASIFEGKIYVVEGTNSDSANPFFEVFDPVTNCWTSGSSPPSFPDQSFLHPRFYGLIPDSNELLILVDKAKESHNGYSAPGLLYSAPGFLSYSRLRRLGCL